MRAASSTTARVTIKHVATAAGVSPTTVSHTLTGKRRVDPATRERVLAAADRLGYRANRTAQALRAGGTSTIAFMLPEQAAGSVDDAVELREMLDLEYYMRIASAAATTAFENGHGLLLTPRVEDRAQLDALGFDGAIVCDPVRDDRRLRQLEAAGIPAVTIERELGQPEHRWYVAGDNRQNMRRLLDHLEAAGARRIALLSTVGDWAWSAETEEAFTDWSAERGRQPLIEPTSLRGMERSAYERTVALLVGDTPPRRDRRARRRLPERRPARRARPRRAGPARPDGRGRHRRRQRPPRPPAGHGDRPPARPPGRGRRAAADRPPARRGRPPPAHDALAAACAGEHGR